MEKRANVSVPGDKKQRENKYNYQYTLNNTMKEINRDM